MLARPGGISSIAPKKRCRWTGPLLAAPGARRSCVRWSGHTAVDVTEARHVAADGIPGALGRTLSTPSRQFPTRGTGPLGRSDQGVPTANVRSIWVRFPWRSLTETVNL